MSVHMASSSYDGDAGSASAAKAAPARCQKQVTDTDMAGNGRDGSSIDDTTIALTGKTTSSGKLTILGKRPTLAGRSGSKAANSKAGGHAITKNKKKILLACLVGEFNRDISLNRGAGSIPAGLGPTIIQELIQSTELESINGN